MGGIVDCKLRYNLVIDAKRMGACFRCRCTDRNTVMLRLRHRDGKGHRSLSRRGQLADIAFAGISAALAENCGILRQLQSLCFDLPAEMVLIDLRQIQLILIRIEFIGSERAVGSGAGKMLIITVFLL